MPAVRRIRLRLRPRTYYHIDRDISPTASGTPGAAQWRKADWAKVRECLEHRLKVLDRDHSNDTSNIDRRQTNGLDFLDERGAQLQMIIQDAVRNTIPLAKPSR